MNGVDALAKRRKGKKMALFVPQSALTRPIGSDGLVLNLATDDWYGLP